MKHASSMRLRSTIVVVSSILIFAFVAVCMVAAAPRSRVSDPLPDVTVDTGIIIDAPASPDILSFDDTRVREAADIDAPEDTIVIISDTPIFYTPAVVETTAAEPAIKETAIPETEAIIPETAIPETEPPAPETTAPETVPEPPSLFASGSTEKLAAKLGVAHTIVPRTQPITEYELILTATVIQLEVMGDGSKLYLFEDVQEKYWEMLSVAQCIRNRSDSKRFPNTPKDVILQSHTNASGTVIYQFSPAEKLAMFTPTAEAITAAREVLVDGVTVLPSNYYYFCASRIESNFEEWNSYGFVKKENGEYDKIQGHLTTFYAGRP